MAHINEAGVKKINEICDRYAGESHVAVVKRDRVIMEVSGPSEEICLEALRLASHKLPCKTKIVRKEKGGENNEE